MSPLERSMVVALVLVLIGVSYGIPTSKPVVECPSRVRVLDDAWFCVASDASGVCAGSQQGACPGKGAQAVDGCAPHHASFQQATGDCAAPRDAQCVQLLPSHDWICVFPAANATASPLHAESLSTLGSASTPQEEPINSTTLNGIVGGAVVAVGLLSVALARRRRYSAPEAPRPPAVTPLYFRESSYVRL